MPNTLSDQDWTVLVSRITQQRCTPFLGAGACYGVLPLGSDVARTWADKYQFPLANASNLIEVAQYLAVQYDPMFPKDEIVKAFKAVQPPNFNDPTEPHGVLAGLPLPVYLTTNYDDFMVRALKAPPRFKEPRQELCHWHETLRGEPSAFDDGDYTPTVANPTVFHLHGHLEVSESLVLTEDDYVDFLAAMIGNQDLLPPPIKKVLSRSTCLFIGYSLADINFRVLFQSLRGSLSGRSFAVLLPPGDTEEKREAAQKYLTAKYSDLDLRVYWGTAREFCAELQQRLTASQK